MKLLVYYIALTLFFDSIAAGMCLGIEKVVPWLGLPLFLGLFFAILWAAWSVAVRVTEPKIETAPLAGATSDQRA